jgi:hypothetical protein
LEGSRSLPAGVTALTESLPRAVREAGSLEQLEWWLGVQRGVRSVTRSDYLVKTEPPMQELTVRFALDDGSTVEAVIDIRIRRDGSLELAGFHEP